MFFSPMGFAIGLAIAQRNNLPQSSAVPVGLMGGVAGNTPLGLVMALVLAQRSQPQPPVSVAVVGAPAVPAVQQAQIGTATGIKATAQELSIGGPYVVEIQWGTVPNATQYIVNCYHRNRATAKWEMREAVTVPHGPIKNVLPSAAKTETAVQTNYGYSVTALNGLNNVGPKSDIYPVTMTIISAT